MQENGRTKNATRNIISGIFLTLLQTVVPFLMRSAMIYFMGIQYLGLNSLFASVLQVLNMAELGVGSAMVYSMYRPIAEKDTVTICALMRLYKIYYRVIGLFIAIVGVVLTPFIPKLISGEVPGNLNVYYLYLLNLGATVLSYWLFAYKNAVIQAHQRMDIINKVSLVIFSVQYGIQFWILWCIKDYYIYILVTLATQVWKNIVTAYYANKYYPDYKPNGILAAEKRKEINGRIRDLFTSRIGMVILNSADTIVISAFLGLTVLAVYQNYYFVLTAIIGLVQVIFSSVVAGIGNSLVVETREKNFKDFKVFTLIICWISCICACCFLNLFQPFIELWVGKECLLDYPIVICLVIYFYIYEISRLINVYKDSAGIWHEDRFRPLIVSLTNLGLNLLMVRYIGLYGIVLSTVAASLFVSIPWLIHNVFTYIFGREFLAAYIIKISVYTVVTAVAAILSVRVCKWIVLAPVMEILCRLIICLMISNACFFLLFRKTEEAKKMFHIIEVTISSKIAKRGVGRK